MKTSINELSHMFYKNSQNHSNMIDIDLELVFIDNLYIYRLFQWNIDFIPLKMLSALALSKPLSISYRA